MREEKDVDNVLWAPYAYENYDPEDIQKRMDLLVPDNMLVVFQSQTAKKDKEKTPEKFLTEKWYQKEFMIEEIEPEFKEHLKQVLPMPDMLLGHAPPNKFMPKAENLKNMKLSRDYATPVIISKSDNFELWFK